MISSPTAMVYYHCDATTNILWHIRGLKRIWVYPACDERFISQRLMEDIFASVMDEEVPYDPSFDDDAVAFDLKPRDVVSWPFNAPHRIMNLGTVNVSLSNVPPVGNHGAPPARVSGQPVLPPDIPSPDAIDGGERIGCLNQAFLVSGVSSRGLAPFPT